MRAGDGMYLFRLCTCLHISETRGPIQRLRIAELVKSDGHQAMQLLMQHKRLVHSYVDGMAGSETVHPRGSKT